MLIFREMAATITVYLLTSQPQPSIDTNGKVFGEFPFFPPPLLSAAQINILILCLSHQAASFCRD